MSSRAFQFSQAANIGINVFPDLSVLPAVGDVVSAATVATGKVTWRYNGPAGVGVFLPLTGGTLTNYLSLHADPANDEHASTKRYVDASTSNALGIVANNYLALAGGTLTGLLNLAAAAPAQPQHATRKDYVDTSVSVALATVASTYLPLAGGVLAGMLQLPATTPTLGTHATTKDYVDTKAASYLPLGGGTLTGLLTGVGITATGTLTVGQTASGNAVLVMNAPAGATRAIRMQSGGLLRWQFTFVTAESTGNAGADLLLTRYDDTGASLGSIFTFTRSSGAAKFQAGVSVWNVATPAARPAVTGSRGGNAALASFLTAMASYGYITDSTTA